MPDIIRFIIFTAAAFLLFVALLWFVIRSRKEAPNFGTMIAISFIVVIVGMVFARYSHLTFRALPWWIYYGLPVLTTVLLPPIWLRMSRSEVLQYLPLAWMIGPVIHVFFSLFVGWHDYMPFPVYIPSIAALVRHAAG